MTVDADRTLAAMQIHQRWEVVKLKVRDKKPWAAKKGDPWTVTKDPAVVARWLTTGHGNGLIAHERTGLAVLDPDNMLVWADMIETLGQPAAAWVLTGRGRLHYYIRWEPDLPAKLTWNGVTVGEIQRGPGQQQIVAPPSTHPDTGKKYEWLVDPCTQPLEPLPGLWHAYLTGQTYASRYGRR